MEKTDLAVCPFCKDGGKPYSNEMVSGCQSCGCVLPGPAEKWNCRSFAAPEAAAAAYACLVRMGAAYIQFKQTAKPTWSRKKLDAARNKFVYASAEFLNEHAGTVRSALNDLEGGKVQQ